MSLKIALAGLSLLFAAKAAALGATPQQGVDFAKGRADEFNAYPVMESYNPKHLPECYAVEPALWTFVDNAANRPQLLTLYSVWSLISKDQGNTLVPWKTFSQYYPDLTSFTKDHPDRLNHDMGDGFTIGCFKTEAEARTVQKTLNDAQLAALRP